MIVHFVAAPLVGGGLDAPSGNKDGSERDSCYPYLPPPGGCVLAIFW